MFGERHTPPKPPRYEPWLLLVLAVLIASLAVVAYVAVSVLFAGP